jgi:hypothetical protein
MAVALSYFQLSVFNAIYKPVCFVNPPAPKTRKVAGQGFRLAYTIVAVAAASKSRRGVFGICGIKRGVKGS